VSHRPFKNRLYAQFIQMYKGYEGYQRSTNRCIPVVILKPTDSVA